MAARPGCEKQAKDSIAQRPQRQGELGWGQTQTQVGSSHYKRDALIGSGTNKVVQVFGDSLRITGRTGEIAVRSNQPNAVIAERGPDVARTGTFIVVLPFRVIEE